MCKECMTELVKVADLRSAWGETQRRFESCCTQFFSMATFYVRAAALAEALEAYVREVAETNPEALTRLLYIRSELLEHVYEMELTVVQKKLQAMECAASHG